MERKQPPAKRVLIAGFGNVLRGDDGFGVEVVRALELETRAGSLVSILEVGIGGITMIQELMDGYEVVVIVDALTRGGQPGEVSWSALEVRDCRKLPLVERQAMLADIHYANPNRALVLARALDLLPESVYLLGCEVDPANELGTDLSQPVRKAVPRAQRLLEEWVSDFSKNQLIGTTKHPEGVPS